MTADARPTAREINETIRYTCWTVFHRTGAELPADAAAELHRVVDELAAADVVVRG